MENFKRSLLGSLEMTEGLEDSIKVLQLYLGTLMGRTRDPLLTYGELGGLRYCVEPIKEVSESMVALKNILTEEERVRLEQLEHNLRRIEDFLDTVERGWILKEIDTAAIKRIEYNVIRQILTGTGEIEEKRRELEKLKGRTKEIDELLELAFRELELGERLYERRRRKEV